tara:strand:+ start:593 stop:1297 length:705 start_codon:yes stop_codon:yes gene_type:complete
MNYIGLICARSGSKGLMNKNIKFINNHPLIAWSINIGNKIKQITQLIVSSEDENIQQISIKYGAEVLFTRPKELAMDDTPEWLVWKHALEFLENDNKKIDALVILPTTAPLRHIQDIENAMHLYENEKCDAVISVKNASRNPYFNMTKVNNEGFSEIVKKSDYHIFNRQGAPKIYDMSTVVYVISSTHIKRNKHLFEGLIKQIIIPDERAIDIDTQLDFDIAEMLLKKNNYQLK